MKPGKIYFDNCVTTPLAPEALDAMLPYFSDKFWFPGTFITTGEATNSALEEFHAVIAKTLNAAPEEIHFTSGGTLANNIAIKGLAAANASAGKHVIVSVVDYPDLLTNAAWLEKQGYSVSYLTPDADGIVSADELKAAIRPDTILFLTTIVNHVVGAIQPMDEYRRVLDEVGHKIHWHADAGQAYGKMHLDMPSLGVDTLSISAHKIHGPQGVGALYVKKGTRLAQLIHGISRVDKLQTGGIGIALVAGFAKAAELTFADLDASIAQLRELSDYLLERLEATIPEIELNGPRGENRISHNINISLAYIEGEAIMMMLDSHGITVATGSACASQGLKPSYVLLAMGRNHVQSHGSMKFTLSRYNTKTEIDFAVERLAEIAKSLRERSPLYQSTHPQEK